MNIYDNICLIEKNTSITFTNKPEGWMVIISEYPSGLNLLEGYGISPAQAFYDLISQQQNPDPKMRWLSP